jgi:hypothetical protein
MNPSEAAIPNYDFVTWFVLELNCGLGEVYILILLVKGNVQCFLLGPIDFIWKRKIWIRIVKNHRQVE